MFQKGTSSYGGRTRIHLMTIKVFTAPPRTPQFEIWRLQWSSAHPESPSSLFCLPHPLDPLLARFPFTTFASPHPFISRIPVLWPCSLPSEWEWTNYSPRHRLLAAFPYYLQPRSARYFAINWRDCRSASARRAGAGKLVATENVVTCLLPWHPPVMYYRPEHDVSSDCPLESICVDAVAEYTFYRGYLARTCWRAEESSVRDQARLVFGIWLEIEVINSRSYFHR